MTTKLAKTLLTCFLLTGFVGACAFNNNDSGTTNEQDRRDNELTQKLRAEYADVEGQYSGTIYAPDRQIPIDLRIITTEVKSGTSSSGNIKIRPELKATLTQLDSTDPDINLSVQYTKESGDLIFPPDDSFMKVDLNSANAVSWSIYAKAAGGILTGEVRQNSGVIGKFEARRISTSAHVPTSEEVNARVAAILQEVAGRYVGSIPFGEKMDSHGKPVPDYVDIEITATVSRIGPSVVITCSFGQNGSSFGSQAMSGYYYPTPRPGKLRVKDSEGAGLKICPLISFDGWLQGDKLSVEGTYRRGGTIKTVFTRLPVTSPNVR